MWLAWDASGLGIHVEESELTDQHLGYDELRTTGGKSVAEAMSAIIKTVAGLSVGAVLVWYLIKFFSPSATQPAAPVNPNPPTATATAPTPVTGTVSYLDLVTEDFIKHNPKEMTWPDAQAGARTCIQDTEWAIGVGALTGSNATDPCQNQFIYLPSSEYPETTSHNWDAIQSYPAWIRLNYVSNADRKAAPLSRTWYSSYTPCSTNTDSTKSCDEYPFFSSAQSRPNSRGTGNEASLRVVDALQNSLAGSGYGNFVRRTDCDLTSGGPTASPSSPSSSMQSMSSIVAVCPANRLPPYTMHQLLTTQQPSAPAPETAEEYVMLAPNPNRSGRNRRVQKIILAAVACAAAVVAIVIIRANQDSGANGGLRDVNATEASPLAQAAKILAPMPDAAAVLVTAVPPARIAAKTPPSRPGILNENSRVSSSLIGPATLHSKPFEMFALTRTFAPMLHSRDV
jgi:hypothetical protein